MISVKITSFNPIQTSIYPVQELFLVVYGQSIRGTDVSLHYELSAETAKIGSLYPWLATVPVGPKHAPEKEQYLAMLLFNREMKVCTRTCKLQTLKDRRKQTITV